MDAAGGWAQGSCVRKLQQELHEAARQGMRLAEGIYVAPHEADITRVDALVVGPESTPYEGGFFHFSLHFPPDYPLRPPTVKVVNTDSGKVRFGPNLYADGKVCLSILGTWHEGPQWTAEQSLRSVLLSVQSLMDEQPYHNEPGFEGPERRPGDAARYAAMVRHEVLRVAVVDMLKHPTWHSRGQEIRDVLTPAMHSAALSWYRSYSRSLAVLRPYDRRPFDDPFGHIKSGSHDCASLGHGLWQLGLLHDFDLHMPTIRVAHCGTGRMRSVTVLRELPAPPGCGDAIRSNLSLQFLAHALGLRRVVLDNADVAERGGMLDVAPGVDHFTCFGEIDGDGDSASAEEALAAARERWHQWRCQLRSGDSPSAAGGGAAAVRRLSSSASVGDDERKCRYCFCGSDDGDDPLITPCGCRGDQRWCHLGCLRRWQRAVLVQQPTHPQHYGADTRQTHCNVCKRCFTVAPPSRAELMRSFSGEELAQLLTVGCLIVTTKRMNSALSQLVQQTGSQSLRFWVRGVYLIVQVEEDGDESDIIVAVNLNGRTVPVAVQPSDGEVVACIGGPCHPERRSAAAVLMNTSHEELPACGTPEARGSGVWRGGTQGGLWAAGNLRAVQQQVLADWKRAVAAGDRSAKQATVRLWGGDARWTRTQLLGELARGNWGMCAATADDLRPNPDLWEQLVDGSRLLYAPRNEMSSLEEEEEDEDDEEAAPSAAAAPKGVGLARERFARERLRRKLLDQQRQPAEERPRRIREERTHWERDPPPFVTVLSKPGEEPWRLMLRGPPETPFEGGEYAAEVHFPPDYPSRPPAISVSVDTGRLPVGEPLRLPCVEQWLVRSSVATAAVEAMVALLEPGGAHDDEKKRLATVAAAARGTASAGGAAPAGAAAAPQSLRPLASIAELCVGERVRLLQSCGRAEAGRYGVIDSVSAGRYSVQVAGGQLVTGLARRHIEPTCLQEGHPVRIVGLTSQPEFDGQAAVVSTAHVNSFLSEAERYTVITPAGKAVTVPRQNLAEVIPEAGPPHA